MIDVYEEIVIPEGVKESKFQWDSTKGKQQTSVHFIIRYKISKFNQAGQFFVIAYWQLTLPLFMINK